MTIERLVLAMVLALQVMIMARLSRLEKEQEACSAMISEAAAEARQTVPAPGDYAGVRRFPPPGPRAWPGHDVFRELDAMLESAADSMREMSLFFGPEPDWRANVALPAMDLREDKNGYTVLMSLPMVDCDCLRVALDGQLLSVISLPAQETLRMPGMKGFERRIMFPGPVEEPGARAVFSNGVLRVSVPKSSSLQPRRNRLRLL